jgi:hypothetical protein
MTNAAQIKAELTMIRYEMDRAELEQDGPNFRELRRLGKLLRAAKDFEVNHVVCEFKSEDCHTNGATFYANDDATAKAYGWTIRREVVKVSCNHYMVII